MRIRTPRRRGAPPWVVTTAVLLAGRGLALAEAEADNPLDLDAAVRLAIAKNPTMKLAESRISAARAAARKAHAGFWPRATVGASYTLTNNSALAFSFILNQRAFQPTLDFNDVDTVDDLNAQATLEVPLFTGLRRFRASDAAGHALDAARFGEAAIEAELGYETARAWYGVHKARAFRRAAAAAVNAYEQNLEIARRREAEGALLRQAVLELAVQLARAREDLSRATNGEALALEALRAILGLEEGVPIDVTSPPDLAAPLEGNALERPELSAARAGAEAAEAAIGVAAADWWPQVGLTGSVVYDRGFIEDGDKLSYIAGVGLEWRVFDGFLTAAAVDEARASAARARAEEDRLQLAFRLEREAARIEVRDALARVEVSKEAIGLAETSVELARARFEQGLALPTQLVDAETELTAARIRNAEAVADLSVATVRLRRALGLTPVPTAGER